AIRVRCWPTNRIRGFGQLGKGQLHMGRSGRGHGPSGDFEKFTVLVPGLWLLSFEERGEHAAQISTPNWKCLVFYDDDDDEYSIQYRKYLENSSNAIAPEEPDNSLSMRDEHINTILETESDKVIKSSVEDLIPIPNNVKIYSNPLFEFDDEYISSDVNPLFDEVLEDIECKDTYDSNLNDSTFLVTHISNYNEDEYITPGDDVELLLHRDPSTPIMSIVSILEGFTDEAPLEEND
nr:hypothetical protein [Tanacetum cinerariifolium]